MKLDRITFTGADDSIDPSELVKISVAHPFAEWGILFVRGGMGARFPSLHWVHELLKATKDYPAINLCAHLCGPWVDDLVFGGTYGFGKAAFAHRFHRVQLNFHGSIIPANTIVGLRKAKRQFLFQVDGVNDGLIKPWCEEKQLGSPLFDVSGGAGVLPKEWPEHWGGDSYCGYAGGLGPENVVDQLSGPIAGAAGDNRIWIDMETRVRSKNNAQFDLEKCVQVLESVRPFIVAQP